MWTRTISILKKEIYLPLGLMIILWVGIIWVIFFLFMKSFGVQPTPASLAYLLAASAIAAGGCVAYHHLRIIHGTERAQVLTNLDCTWFDAQLANSRNEFLRFKNRLKGVEGSKTWKRDIINRLNSYKNNRPVTYKKLFNMLDFYESLGYFSRVKYILPRDALELYGPSIKEYDKTFRQHIVKRQKITKDKKIYENFIWLADELENQEN